MAILHNSYVCVDCQALYMLELTKRGGRNQRKLGGYKTQVEEH